MRNLTIALALAAAPCTAAAHVSVTPASAPGGGYQVLRFGTGHGCDGKATTSIRIEVPAAVTVAHPQPKPGWKLAIEKPPGQPDVVRAVTWTGVLPADQFDEFVVQTKLPADWQVAFPAEQRCGAVVIRWDGASPGHPAPTVQTGAATESTGDPHEHHH